MRLLALTALVACGSSSTTTGHTDGGVGPSGDAGKDTGLHDTGVHHDATSDAQVHHDASDAALTDAASPLADAAACPDASVVDGATVINCTGRCGPVLDPCTGSVTACGGCGPAVGPDGGSSPQVCNLSTNTCGPVETTCADLGAQCGTVVTSCGTFLDCPDGTTKGCPAGEQCNNLTNQCETCQPVTCADLGFQCGFAWLGCGPDTQSNYTDCGSCGANQVCNAAYAVCEPNCTPMSAASLCATANAQCGLISNNCGGVIDCDTVAGLGCPAGQGCGLQGQANQCDPAPTPTECIAIGQNCGTLVSACTGQSVNCGQCPMGQVCNANGVCGAPCAPKTCADFSTFQCGTFDDGCKGMVVCGTCPGGVCNQATNTCCTEFTCAGSYAGECGQALADGCGANDLNCACGTGVCTKTGGGGAPPNGTTGTCCTPKTAASYPGQCGTDLSDGCGNNDVNVPCGANQDCVDNGTGAPGVAPTSGTPGTCCTRTDSCSSVPAGQCADISDSCSTATPPPMTLCNECASPDICDTIGGTLECCQPAPACTAGECNVVIQPVTPGCGSARTCDCTGSQVCLCGGVPCGTGGGTGACMTPKTCANYPNECGTGLSNGAGGAINCLCGNGMVCSTSTPGQTGTCQCNNPTGVAYTCANVPNGPMTGGPPCGSFNNGCGASINCGCSTPGDVCNTSVNPATCCAPTSCPANPGTGSDCGKISNGCGGQNNCGCGTSGDVCNASVNPSVCCAAASCPANPTVGTACGSMSNNCGGNNNCGCGAQQVCHNSTCCAPTSCPANPGVGSACGSISDGCGANNNCSCPTGTNNENFTCTNNVCACVPNSCSGISGLIPNGCGGTIMCQS